MIERLTLSDKFLRGFLSGLIGSILALSLWGLDQLDTLENLSWDWRVSFLAEPGQATDEIRLIRLDQPSLDWVEKEIKEPWPWRREMYAIIINFCLRSQVKGLAFDVLFTEFSKSGVADDEAFGAAIAGFPDFAAGTIILSNTMGSDRHWPDDFPEPEFTIAGLDEWVNVTKANGIIFPRAVLPIQEVAQNADILCNVQHTPDFDGVSRRIQLFNIFDNRIFPSLGLGTYLTRHRDTKMQIKPGKFTIGDKSIPIDNNGNTILRYRGPSGTHRYYAAAELIQAEFRIFNEEAPTTKDLEISEDLKDKYVLFGFTAPGLFDLRTAPVDRVYPGVEINATVLDNLLSGDFIAKAPIWVTVTLVLLLVLPCGILASLFSKPLENVFIGGIFLVIPVLLAVGAYLQGFWLPLAVQETAAAITVIASLVINYATEGKQKRFIKNAFKQYLSPAVIEQLIQHPDQLRLGGERKVLSIFFSDLQGFTSISEHLSPEDLTTLLNDYLSAMTDIIHEEGGTIDKYEGDAIIAFWNAPLNVPDHAVRVVRAALRCQKTLAELRPIFKERTGKELFMRIGMNSGPAVVGNMGSHTRFDYTMLGDAVNLAARLEGVNKQFGTYTMISQSTLDLLGDTFAVRELARVAVVGRKEPVTVYEPMFHEEYQARKETLETFVQGLELFYRGNFEEAIKIFTHIHNLDPPAAKYIEKCYTLRYTPPENWQGVWIMTTK